MPTDPAWVEAMASMLLQIERHRTTTRVPMPLEIAVSDTTAVFEKHLPHRKTALLIIQDLKKAISEAPTHWPPSLTGPNGKIPSEVSDLVHSTGAVLRDSTRLATAVATLSTVRDELMKAAAHGMRWGNLVDAFRGGRSTHARRLRAADRFRIAWILSGRDWAFFPDRLAGILRDEAFHISIATGDIEDLEGRAVVALMGQRAGLPLDQRIELCRTLVTADPQKGTCDVWLRFTQATTKYGAPISLGNVTVFDDHVLASLLKDRHHPLLPAELNEEGFHLRETNPDSPLVYVRVHLDDQDLDTAVSQASRVAGVLVRRAALHAGPVWNMDDWSTTFFNGRYVGLSSGKTSFTVVGSDAMAYVAKGLAGAAPLARALAENRSHLDAVTQLLGPLTQVMTGPSGVRVSTAARLLEHLQNPLGQLHWLRIVRRYLRDQWALCRLQLTVVQAIRDCLRPHAPGLGAQAQNDIESLLTRLSDGSGALDWQGVVPELSAASRIFDVTSAERIQLQDAATYTATGGDALKRLRHFQDEFDALLNRMTRCRHGITHGWPVASALLESVEDFAASVTVSAIDLSIDGIVNNGDVEAALLTYDAEAKNRIALLGASPSLGEIGTILFPKA